MNLFQDPDPSSPNSIACLLSKLGKIVHFFTIIIVVIYICIMYSSIGVGETREWCVCICVWFIFGLE